MSGGLIGLLPLVALLAQVSAPGDHEELFCRTYQQTSKAGQKMLTEVVWVEPVLSKLSRTFESVRLRLNTLRSLCFALRGSWSSPWLSCASSSSCALALALGTGIGSAVVTSPRLEKFSALYSGAFVFVLEFTRVFLRPSTVDIVRCRTPPPGVDAREDGRNDSERGVAVPRRCWSCWCFVFTH